MIMLRMLTGLAALAMLLINGALEGLLALRRRRPLGTVGDPSERRVEARQERAPTPRRDPQEYGPAYASNSDFVNGWYSHVAAKQFGFVVYRSVTGHKVKVTEISAKATPASRWPDLTFIGAIKRGSRVTKVSAPSDAEVSGS